SRSLWSPGVPSRCIHLEVYALGPAPASGTRARGGRNALLGGSRPRPRPRQRRRRSRRSRRGGVRGQFQVNQSLWSRSASGGVNGGGGGSGGLVDGGSRSGGVMGLPQRSRKRRVPASGSPSMENSP